MNEPMRELYIPAAMAKLDKALKRSNDAFEKLVVKLVDVLSSDPKESGVESAGPTNQCPLALRLLEYAERLDTLSDRIEDTERRCELLPPPSCAKPVEQFRR